MKNHKVQILLSVLVFASLCGAPKSPRTRVKAEAAVAVPKKTQLTRVRRDVAAAAAVPVDGLMSKVAKPKAKAPKSSLSKVATGREGDASSATASPRSRSASPKRPASPKSRRPSTADASDVKLAVDPTDGFVG